MPKPLGIERLYTQLGSCHGPAGGAPAAGVGGRGGGSAGRIPRDTPPSLSGRGSHQDTETQTSTFCELVMCTKFQLLELRPSSSSIWNLAYLLCPARPGGASGRPGTSHVAAMRKQLGRVGATARRTAGRRTRDIRTTLPPPIRSDPAVGSSTSGDVPVR
jgi:hypothetical protein